MSKLSTEERKELPSKDFAGPGRSYPIEDENHARNALSRVSQFGSPAVKAEVRAKVHGKFPSIGEKIKGQVQALHQHLHEGEVHYHHHEHYNDAA